VKKRYLLYLVSVKGLVKYYTKENDVQLPSVVTRYELLTVVFRTCIGKF